MTTIKIGNQEVESGAARAIVAVLKLAQLENETPTPPDIQQAIEALSTAIKEAEEVEGPFGIDEGDIFTFRGEVVTDAGGVALYGNFVLTPILNRILSQHFVSKDELRDALDANRNYGALRNAVTALIEKGAPDA